MSKREIGRVTSSDGTSIAFECVGAGPAVILVDAAGNFRGFSPMPQLAEALAQDFTVFTYDRRGKGASTDTLPYAVDRELDDLHALVDLAGANVFVQASRRERSWACSQPSAESAFRSSPCSNHRCESRPPHRLCQASAARSPNSSSRAGAATHTSAG
jgi:hypothetical protein